MTYFFRRIEATYLYFLLLIICLCWSVSCRKLPPGDDILKFSYLFINDEGKEQYAIDSKLTITFDTVFTSIGSATKYFVVHNTSTEDIKTTILLARDKQSFFSINVNGISGTFFKDIEIPRRDSIFILVKVNINPLNQNNPFLVTDSIVFFTSSRQQDVKLLACGQDARYIVADKIIKDEEGNEILRYKLVAGEHETVTWTKDRPYVVYGYALIDSAGTLNIEPGTKIYFHKNAGLWAAPYSTLKVSDPSSTSNEPVLFRGDRLESWYNRDYAQWSRIWINEGADVEIHNAIITNALVGVQVEPFFNGGITVTSNIVKIENTIIKNTQLYGVFSRFLNIDMTNCVIANTGEYSLLLEGGNHTIKHVTIANYFIQKERKKSACYVSNFVSLYKNPWELKADFTNCIIYGKNTTEAVVNKSNEAELEVSFQNCFIRSKDNSPYFKDCFLNEYPQFVDTLKHDFQLLPGSPAIGKGKPNIGVPLDILGNSRGDIPDIGAYQFVR